MHYPAKKFVAPRRNVDTLKKTKLNSLLGHLLHFWLLHSIYTLILKDFANNLKEYLSKLRANVAEVWIFLD